MKEIRFIKGSVFEDARGKLSYNNTFNASEIKRIYTLEHTTPTVIRGWQGHKVEQRWFSVMKGSFEIQVIEIDNWDAPSKILKPNIFKISDKSLDFLQVPSGCITRIQALEKNSKLLVFADYLIGEIQDEYRFDLEYFS